MFQYCIWELTFVLGSLGFKISNIAKRTQIHQCTPEMEAKRTEVAIIRATNSTSNIVNLVGVSKAVTSRPSDNIWKLLNDKPWNWHQMWPKRPIRQIPPWRWRHWPVRSLMQLTWSKSEWLKTVSFGPKVSGQLMLTPEVLHWEEDHEKDYISNVRHAIHHCLEDVDVRAKGDKIHM